MSLLYDHLTLFSVNIQEYIFLVCLEINGMPLEDKGLCRDTLSADIKYLSHIYLRTAYSGKLIAMIFGVLENFLQFKQQIFSYSQQR